MARMIFGQRSGVVVDVCRAHGTWFDAGELDAVLEFVRFGGLEHDVARASEPSLPVSGGAASRRAAAPVEAPADPSAEPDDDLVQVLFGGRPWH
jgi:hypothetical protein